MTAQLSDIYHFEQMTDWLGTSGQPSETQFAAIAAEGYSAVINLALNDHEFALPNEGQIVTGHSMAYFHIPVRFDAPKLDELRLFFSVLDALEGKKAWVHCVVNARVSVFVYHYLTVRKGVAAEKARSSLLNRWEPDMDNVWREFWAIAPEALTA